MGTTLLGFQGVKQLEEVLTRSADLISEKPDIAWGMDNPKVNGVVRIPTTAFATPYR